MGGSGAKNRRRQQRQGSSEEAPSSKKNPDSKPWHQNVRSSSSTAPNKSLKKPPIKKKEKKFKKPKHLKRKLQAMTENDEDRPRLEQELKAWEECKATTARAREATPPLKKSKVVSKQNPKTVSELEDLSAVVANEEMVEQKPSKESNRETVSVSHDVIKVNNDDGEDAPKNAKDESDSEESVTTEEVPTRHRGKRRRGRKDTSKQVALAAADEAPVLNESTSSAQNNNDKRYCIGRKPLTDFKIGEYYDGKVVYVKPFGIFIDIGCHSDAFCHVSRLADDYVESPETVFQAGVAVRARIVELDRRQKKVTVSLQSESRIADEKASMEARTHRKEKRRSSRPSKNNKAEQTTAAAVQTEDTTEEIFETKGKNESVPSVLTKPESDMSPAELKRARKLKRRASRREQQQVSSNLS